MNLNERKIVSMFKAFIERVFVPQLPHVIFACTEEVVLPWKAARPFLSDAGTAVRKSLR